MKWNWYEDDEDVPVPDLTNIDPEELDFEDWVPA